MKRQDRNYIGLAVLLIAIIIVAAALFSYSKNSNFLSGSKSGQSNKLTNTQNTTSSASTTIQINNSTTIIESKSSSVSVTTANTTSIIASTSAPSTTSIISYTTTAAPHVGGGQCVSGCGSPSTPLTAMITVSNATVSQKGTEFLNATWNGGSGPFAVNYTITNTINNGIIANALYTGVSGSSNSLTFQVPFSINSLGTANVSLKVTSGSKVASAFNSISINLASISYTYNGATSSGSTSLSTNVLPLGSLIYFCTGAGYIGTLGTSWTTDESSSTWTSIGQQSLSSLCSFTQVGTGGMYLAGIGVSNALTYSTFPGSNTISPSSYEFSYSVTNTSEYTFILVGQIAAYNPVISVSPSSGTCSTVEDQTSSSDAGYAAIEVCHGQSPNTYMVTVSDTNEGSDTPGYVVYSVT